MSGALRLWNNPAPDELGGTVYQFLGLLGGPCCIIIPGKDATRCRFVVTLLHGNEPSGAIALHRWLTVERSVPAVDLYLVVMNVPAALEEPPFSYRQLPDTRDLNRCFKEPFEDDQGTLAKALLDLIHRMQPEALIDLHNTSGMGPAFGVAIYFDQKHDALVSFFTERLVVTDLRLGALMELSEQDVPTVTIECGGAGEEESHRTAFDGLQRYFLARDLFSQENTAWPIDVLHNPVRLELDSSLSIAYGEQANPAVDICLRVDIEHFNFGEAPPDVHLGWVSDRGWAGMQVLNSKGDNLRDEFLRRDKGVVFPATKLKLFMITGNPAIALSDCLFYAVKRS